MNSSIVVCMVSIAGMLLNDLCAKIISFTMSPHNAAARNITPPTQKYLRICDLFLNINLENKEKIIIKINVIGM